MERIENVYDVTHRLLGMINPVGDSGVDQIRLLNLKDTIQVSERLLMDIFNVANTPCNGEASILALKTEAKNYLTELLSTLDTEINQII